MAKGNRWYILTHLTKVMVQMTELSLNYFILLSYRIWINMINVFCIKCMRIVRKVRGRCQSLLYTTFKKFKISTISCEKICFVRVWSFISFDLIEINLLHFKINMFDNPGAHLTIYNVINIASWGSQNIFPIHFTQSGPISAH